MQKLRATKYLIEEFEQNSYKTTEDEVKIIYGKY